jgi:hypothetical protein
MGVTKHPSVLGVNSAHRGEETTNVVPGLSEDPIKNPLKWGRRTELEAEYGRKEDIDMESLEKLADAYERKGDVDMEIAIRKNLVEKNLSYRRLQHRLARAYGHKGDIDMESLEKLADAYERKGDVDMEIAGWKDFVEKNPSSI